MSRLYVVSFSFLIVVLVLVWLVVHLRVTVQYIIRVV